MKTYMTLTRTQEDAIVRSWLGHDIGTCRVSIHRNGNVTAVGSTSDTDRSCDYRRFCGYREKILREATR